MNPTTTRPDPVTEARDALLTWLEPYFAGRMGMRESRVLVSALDNLIALVRAEAGVSAEALVELLSECVVELTKREDDSPEAVEHYLSLISRCDVALAARPAGSGSRVEDPEWYQWFRGTRPTPPPAVDGTRCGWRLKHGDRCDATRVAVWHEVPVAPYNDANHPFTPPAPESFDTPEVVE